MDTNIWIWPPSIIDLPAPLIQARMFLDWYRELLLQLPYTVQGCNNCPVPCICVNQKFVELWIFINSILKFCCIINLFHICMIFKVLMIPNFVQYFLDCIAKITDNISGRIFVTLFLVQIFHIRCASNTCGVWLYNECIWDCLFYSIYNNRK